MPHSNLVPSLCPTTPPLPAHPLLRLLHCPVLLLAFHKPLHLSCPQLTLPSPLLFSLPEKVLQGLLIDCLLVQGVLSKHIGQLRVNTARHTDERVRLAGEAIAGSLAIKMLGHPPSPPAYTPAAACSNADLHSVAISDTIPH